MAAHGTGVFENDNAADLILEVYELRSWRPAIKSVRAKLSSFLGLRDAMNAEFALASIGLSLVKLGKFGFEKFAEQVSQVGFVGDDPDGFLQSLPSPNPGVLMNADRVIEIVSSPDHALSFSWSETDYYQSWLEEIKYLKDLISE